MNPYGDPNAARGRAQVPGGPGADGGYDDYAPHDVYPAYDDSPPVAPGRVPIMGGSPPVGRASVGRASVSSGGYQYDDEPSLERTIGRASVPGATAGAAVTGRAVVPGVRPAGPAATGPGVPAAGRPTARSRKRRRLNWIIAGFAVFIMVAGGVVIGGTYYYDTIPPVEALDLPESSVVNFSDGTQLAKLGEANRILVPLSQVPPHVQRAVVAAEDKDFYEHDGVDPVGIARAAWNNVTGGDTQGASTITQQYARHVANLTDITYARKVREAVLATKLESEYEKDEILGFYINTIYFGRGAHGIEAAARTYFKKGVGELSVDEAAVLAAVIRQPEPEEGGHQGYDPQVNPTDATGRWAYVLDNMVGKGWLSQAERDAAQYPKPANAKDPKERGSLQPFDGKSCASTAECGINTPVGNVVNYVGAELKAMGIQDWKHGGYRVTTSIIRPVQAAAQAVARRAEANSELAKQPKNLMASLVAIDPATGRVIAYYGGDSGVGYDFAGLNYDKNGGLVGGRPAGSSFKIYTLLAALRENISINSYWDATKYKDGPFTLSNAGRNPACKQWCSLEDSTVQSFNVPFYWITKYLGSDKVLQAAKDAGVRSMWTNEGTYTDLGASKANELAPSKFGTQIGFGQYPITVLDHATGLATIANRGTAAKTHFVVKVERKDPETGQWKVLGGKAAEKLEFKEVFEKNKVDDIVSVLQKVPGANGDALKGGRPAASKTGTWELDNKHSSENGDAWTIGFTKQIATAVWVGSTDHTALYQTSSSGRKTKISGGSLPGTIWKKFMDAAHTALNAPEVGFPDRKNTGDPEIAAKVPGAGVSPSTDAGCIFLPLCPTPPGDPGNGGGGPGGGGPGGGLPPTRSPRG